ncbi:MAG: polysaccharide deacetylase family protein [Symbiobacteriia bacterium]
MLRVRPRRFPLRLYLGLALVAALTLAGCAGRVPQRAGPVPPVASAVASNGLGDPATVATSGSTAIAGAAPLANITAARGVRVPILMYHEIGDGPNELYVSEKSFAAQLDLLVSRGYQSITLDQLYEALQGKGDLPTHPIVLSFDDGYASAYHTAFPLLQQHGLTGVFFIYTRGVGNAGRVTWDELRQMKAQGMEIESHTISHLDLPRLSLQPQRLKDETAGSRANLQAELGTSVEYFCYPAGRYNAAVIQAVKDAGYKAALTTKPGFADSSQSPYEWRRVRISRSDSLGTFEAKLGLKSDAGPVRPVAGATDF